MHYLIRKFKKDELLGKNLEDQVKLITIENVARDLQVLMFKLMSTSEYKKEF